MNARMKIMTNIQLSNYLYRGNSSLANNAIYLVHGLNQTFVFCSNLTVDYIEFAIISIWQTGYIFQRITVHNIYSTDLFLYVIRKSGLELSE
jgi:hypothetical protein